MGFTQSLRMPNITGQCKLRPILDRSEGLDFFHKTEDPGLGLGVVIQA
jgi:hypothetical protein